MYRIIVHKEGDEYTIETDGQDLLLAVLRNSGNEIYAPCGGNGTCGKCKVWIQGEGSVATCVYAVWKNIIVVLPNKREAQILIDQHKYTLSLPFKPGSCRHLSLNPYGVAIDLGTTSLVYYLVDLITGVIVETRAESNPQASYGADVISRINFTAQNKNGLTELQNVILDSINDQFEYFRQKMGLRRNDLVKIAIAGNTTMIHILLGVDPIPIALAPFIPKFTEAQLVKADTLNLYCHPQAEIKTLPCISAYIGADIVAGLASIDPLQDITSYLFMDIGTNGELALVTPDKIWCCATAAGPAFEGDRITHGMTAVEGAISTFGEDGYSTIGNIAPTGLCGSGLIDVMAYLIEGEWVNQEGYMEETFEIVDKDQAGIDQAITINQKDIREVQLAKSAISAGVAILMRKADMDYEVINAVFLAGGFGNYINVDSAMAIGLLSPDFKDKVVSLGNTSGTGAVLSLKSTSFKKQIDSLLSKAIYVELSDEPDFALEFAMNMMFDKK